MHGVTAQYNQWQVFGYQSWVLLISSSSGMDLPHLPPTPQAKNGMWQWVTQQTLNKVMPHKQENHIMKSHIHVILES